MGVVVGRVRFVSVSVRLRPCSYSYVFSRVCLGLFVLFLFRGVVRGVVLVLVREVVRGVSRVCVSVLNSVTRVFNGV